MVNSRQAADRMINTDQPLPQQALGIDNPMYGVPSIKVIGIGGGGSNAVARMYKDRVPGVEYIIVNTDAQHLYRCEVPVKIAIGQKLTRGLGVGGNPEIGRQSAEESREELTELLRGTDMVFIAGGMGGGTGTGAAPVIAEIAQEVGALTIGVVTKPFSFENRQRQRNADDGMGRLKDHVDTLIVIPNDRLLQMHNQRDQNYTWEDALRLADSILQQGIQSIAEVVTVPGEINVDFNDVKAIMGGAGAAWMAIGRGKGENRAVDAAKAATKSPLLDMSIEGAKRLLFTITGGSTLSLKEVQEAASIIEDVADDDANVIFGTVKDLKMEDEVKITLVATGFPAPEQARAHEEQFKRVIKESLPEAEDLDVPTFLRNRKDPAPRRRQGFFR